MKTEFWYEINRDNNLKAGIPRPFYIIAGIVPVQPTKYDSVLLVLLNHIMTVVSHVTALYIATLERISHSWWRHQMETFSA